MLIVQINQTRDQGMKTLTSFAIAVALASTGCATKSSNISAVYVSPLQYSTYDCDQLAAEMARIQTRATQLGGRLDKAASNDKAIATVGVILFWPALFALGGNKDKEAEFSRLSGELEAVQQASIAKKCMRWEADPDKNQDQPPPSQPTNEGT